MLTLARPVEPARLTAILSFLLVWIKAHLTCANFQEVPRWWEAGWGHAAATGCCDPEVKSGKGETHCSKVNTSWRHARLEKRQWNHFLLIERINSRSNKQRWKKVRSSEDNRRYTSLKNGITHLKEQPWQYYQYYHMISNSDSTIAVIIAVLMD